jgi:uncharacterized membrane-anchored protein YhcB (DUF1043 family)
MFGLIILSAAVSVALVLGALIGSGRQTLAQDQRARQQAEKQRQLNEAWRELEQASGCSRQWWRVHLSQVAKAANAPAVGRWQS